MVCQEIAAPAEETSPDYQPELIDADQIVRLKADLEQARHQIAEMEHLLKYRTRMKPPPIELSGCFEVVPPPMPEAPPLPSRRALRKMRARRRRIAFSIAGLVLAAGVALWAIQAKSSESRSQAVNSLPLAAALTKPSPQSALLPVAVGPIISPDASLAKADSPQLAPIPAPILTKQASVAPVVRFHRRHRSHRVAQAAEPKAVSLPVPPDDQTPEPQPVIDKKDGWLE